MMDSKTKSRLISAARKISRWHPERTKVKKAAQVDKALFECSKCGTYCYEGSSGLSYITYQQKYPDKSIVMEYCAIDHIKPVVDPKLGWQGWDIYYERMFCKASNLQAICSTCHTEKTNKEKEIRK